MDAYKRDLENELTSDDFDYWLYIVETLPNGDHQVLPIRNPSRAAAKFEFRSGTWRAFVEDG